MYPLNSETNTSTVKALLFVVQQSNSRLYLLENLPLVLSCLRGDTKRPRYFLLEVAVMVLGDAHGQRNTLKAYLKGLHRILASSDVGAEVKSVSQATVVTLYEGVCGTVGSLMMGGCGDRAVLRELEAFLQDESLWKEFVACLSLVTQNVVKVEANAQVSL